MANIKNDLIEITKNLVGFRTTKDKPEQITNCVSYIKQYFADSDVVIEEYEQNNKPSLFISFFGSEKTELILHGHIDVVEANPEQFKSFIKNNKIYARGAADMKGGLAALMLIMKQFSSRENKPKMGLMVVSDEEIGGYDGTGFLSRQNFFPKFVIGAEPNQAKKHGFLDITTFHKAVLWLKISCEGKSCHASKPWMGENAAEKLIEKYFEIKKLFPQASESQYWNNTLNLGKIISGDSANKVPDFAEMTLDIRYNESIKKEKLVEDIKKIGGLKIEVVDDAPMLKNDNKNNYIQSLKNVVEEKTQNPCNLLKATGSSDLRFFSEKNIPAVIFGKRKKNYHGMDEFVEIDGLVDYFEIIKEFVEQNF